MTTASDSPTTRLVRKIRLRAILFFALALVAGAAAVLLVKLYLDGSRAAAARPLPTRDVVVAAVDVPIGTQLERRHLTVVRWPAASAPAGTFAAAEEVAGRSVEQTLVAGEPVLEARLADPARGRGMAAILRPGHRAMAVKVDQEIGVGGFVYPGDFVDVITTMKPDDDVEAARGSKAARISKLILQDIRVLAAGEHMAMEGQKPVSVPVVTLEVTPEEAERLALGAVYGKIMLTMRSRVDQESVATEGVTPTILLAGDEAARRPAREAVRPAEPEPPKVAVHRPARRPARAEPAAKPVEDKPVVEILRGAKVEQRALRASPDAR